MIVSSALECCKATGPELHLLPMRFSEISKGKHEGAFYFYHVIGLIIPVLTICCKLAAYISLSRIAACNTQTNWGLIEEWEIYDKKKYKKKQQVLRR